MSGLFSKPPKPKVILPASEPSVQGKTDIPEIDESRMPPGALIGTSSSGLQRKANTRKTALIGGS